ncbi:GTP binding protein, putative [Trypanosoma brucei brucei TREU927]|uniref:Obg-like ATPase 1 n=2 Tax=Trypanozoon TaxID=39700 RepID=Q586U4_TRYB2|nr:GTP binding protein, putative [Trypanosoma brucei brucei TREU927]AAQ15964.1 GTP binding protein, putative [Trypanosoma brucei brucei TREU927]AAX80143.1 GTP binding protein, putative [Trypanosoma brucei]
MPPKKKDDKSQESLTVLLGRPGSNLKVGIVGLPNVGKSTFFNVLSKKGVPAENRPFCTIDPNTADINIPDDRFDKLVQLNKPASVVPAQVHIRDIAGLVRGASHGEGLGNAFLSHINECDGVIHMIRVFEEEDITHVEGELDPVRDLDIIFSELVLKDLQVVNGLIDKLTVIVNRGLDKTKKNDLEILHKVRDHLEKGEQVRCYQWNNKEIDFLNTLQLLTAKPAIFLANMSEKDFIRQRSKWLAKLKEWIDKHTGELLIPVSAEMEANLLNMSSEEAEEFLKQNKTKSQVPKIITSAYHAINLIHYFTAGPDEVKCWTIQRGTKAPQAAGKIHSDMEKGFICAEVIHWEDYEKLESEAACREAGKQHQEGRNYEVRDGDIIFFKFNAAKGGKK